MFKAFFKLGGRRWIRTIEAKRNRFTVCPLWPLGNSPLSSFSKIKAYCLNSRLQWSWWTDLNPRPADYKSAALPIEPHRHLSGWRRIRTFEGGANRFTVCPLWPLGNPSIIYGTYRARTYDPLLVRQMLSQLS